MEQPLTLAEMRQRLRWRARRGMLENDILLSRFLDKNEQQMSDPEVMGLYQLLDLADNELFDLILQRQEPQGALACPAVIQILDKLRAN